MSDEDIEWAEQFYSDVEEMFKRIGKEYTRPVDYLERAYRILTGNRNTVKSNIEGKRSGVMYFYE